MSEGNVADPEISKLDAMTLVVLIVELVASEVMFAVLVAPKV